MPAEATLRRRAVFDPAGRHRWWLERVWCPSRPRLLFIGLNPSRADGEREDPTLRRLMAFARGWGYGGVEVVNLFARVTASPAVLRRSADPVGEANDGWITARLRHGRRQAGATPAIAWVGWGNHGAWRRRDREVLALLAGQGVTPVCLGLTAGGQPRHPLYLPSSESLRPAAALCGDRSEVAAPPCPVFPAATSSICC